jgi:hypothetical protein
MTWLPITDAAPGEICPRCDRGTLFIRNSRPATPRWQVQYLWCTHCPVTLKSMVERNELRLRKVV